MTNREEVAKKLRGSGEWLFGYSYSAAAPKAIDILRDAIDSTYDYAILLDSLADLIDPTCEVTLDEELSQEFQGEMFRCNKCNAAFPRINGEYRYCPVCGARVVRDE